MSEFLETYFRRSSILEDSPEEERKKRDEEEKRKLLLDTAEVTREQPKRVNAFLENQFRLDQEKNKVDQAKEELGLRKRGFGKPHGFLSTIFDIASRPLYGLTSLADKQAQRWRKNITGTGSILSKLRQQYINQIQLYGDLPSALREVVSPKERLSWEDVIYSADPVWANANPDLAGVFGFVGDVVLDPLNAVSVGSGTVFKNSLGITRKSGRIQGITKEGEVVFQKMVSVAGDEGLDGIERYNRANSLMQEVLDPTNIPQAARRFKKAVQPIELDDVRQSFSAALEAGDIRTRQAVMIIDNEVLENIISKGKLPGSLLPPEAGIVKLAHAGEAGFSVEALSRIKGGTKFYRIRQGGKAEPILNTVDAVDIKLNKTDVKVSVNPQGKAVVLQGSPSASQQKTIDGLANFRTVITDLAKKRSKVLHGTFVHSQDLDATKILSSVGKKKTPIGVVFPELSVVGVAKRSKKALIDSTTNPHALRFILPGREGLFELDEVRDILRIGDISTESNVVRKAKEAQEIGRKVLEEYKINDIEKLLDQGGLKIFGKTVLTSDNFKFFADASGLTRVLRLIDELPATDELKKITDKLSKNIDLTGYLEKHFPEWMRRRRQWEGTRFSALREAHSAYSSIFDTFVEGKKVKSLTEAERVEVRDFLAGVEKLTKDEANFRGIEPTLELGKEIFQTTFEGSKLSVEQKAAVVKLRQAYNDFYSMEKRLGLEHQMTVNYHPRRYENIRSMDKFKQFRRWQREGQMSPFTPEKKRLFTSDQQAFEAGYEPILDAGRLYLIRHFEHLDEIRHLEIEDFLKSAYGSVEKAPEAIHMDMLRMGETYYQPGAGNEPTYLGKIWDSINKAFRWSATVVRPAFLAKQAIGNFTQLYATIGIDAFKMFQPETLNLALSMSLRNEVKFGFTDVWGIKYSPLEIMEWDHRFPIRKNIALEGLGQISETSLIRNITKDIYTQASFRKFFGSNKEAAQGMLELIKKGAGYLHWPAYLEDTYRMGTFLSAVKMGHSPARAFEITDKAFFNYTSGLTRFEQKIRRSLIPFLSFQKFGMELLLKTGATVPGRINLAGDMGRGLYEVYNKITSGDSLNESERKVLRPYLLEQPHVFERFDSNGLAVFRTFNNMSFFDVVNFLEVDNKGDFSAKDTLIKGGLAQLSPYIKVPLEIIFKRQFFSERALEGAYAGNVGDIDADKLFRNVSTMAGLHGGAGTGILAGIFGAAKNEDQENTWFKRLLSWEETIDPRTGRRTVYINPYILLTTTSLLPGLNEAVKASRNDRTFWDNVLSAAFGINVIKRDLAYDSRLKVQDLAYEKNKALAEYRQYIKEGRLNSAEEAKRELDELIEEGSKELEQIFEEPIRGRTY